MESETATQPIYDALDIASWYFERKGESRLSINQKLAAVICEMFNNGEHRTLMLANLAIKELERHLEAEKTRRPSLSLYAQSLSENS